MMPYIGLLYEYTIVYCISLISWPLALLRPLQHLFAIQRYSLSILSTYLSRHAPRDEINTWHEKPSSIGSPAMSVSLVTHSECESDENESDSLSDISDSHLFVLSASLSSSGEESSEIESDSDDATERSDFIHNIENYQSPANVLAMYQRVFERQEHLLKKKEAALTVAQQKAEISNKQMLVMKNQQLVWFICLAIFNTAGVLPILYIYYYQRDKSLNSN